jgi:hypothetical protein
MTWELKHQAYSVSFRLPTDFYLHPRKQEQQQYTYTHLYLWGMDSQMFSFVLEPLTSHCFPF